MDERDYQDLIGALERFHSEHASNREDARRILREEGIIDGNGALTEAFGGAAVEPVRVA